MDIYFCDLCGARVSDIDLRGGHGIRKQYDVICANCLELGHGKEWLAKHQRGRPASAAGAVKAPAMKVLAAASAGSPTIDAARDRVRTLEEGDNTPAIPAKVIAADDSLDEDARSGELEAEEATRSDTPAQGVSSFAAAASSFSALGAQQPSAKAPSHDDIPDADAPADDGQRIADVASPFELDAKAETSADQAREEADTEHGEGGRRREVSQKDETLPVDRPLVVAPEDRTPPGRKSSSSSTPSGNKKSAAKVSKAGVKAPGKSGRTKAKKNNNIYLMTGLSIAILTMIMLIIISQQGSTKKERETQKLELSESVRRSISEARVAADSSLKTKTVGEMKAALSMIQAIRGEIDKWEVEADKRKWTDEQKGDYMEKIGWPSTASRIRLLNDEIVKAGNGGK